MSDSKRLDFQGARERMLRALTVIESDIRPREEIEAAYRQRAEWLARPLELDAGDAPEDIVIFRLGESRYAVPLRSVAEVTARPLVAPAPGAPESIAGLIQVRGEIRVLWNLRKLLGLAPRGEPGENRTALLLRTGKGEAGVLVDEVEDIRTVNAPDRRPPPDDSSAGAWMTEDLIIVLDTDGLWPVESKTEH